MGDPEYMDPKRLERTTLLEALNVLRRGKQDANGGSDVVKIVGVAIAFTVATGAGVGSWVTNAERITTVENKVETLVQRASEDRAEVKQQVKAARQEAKEERAQMKQQIDGIEKGVNQILIEMRAREIRERMAERRRDTTSSDNRPTN